MACPRREANAGGSGTGTMTTIAARLIDPESGAPVFGAELLGDDAAEDASHDSRAAAREATRPTRR